MERCLKSSRVENVLLTEERRLAADLVVCTELGLDPFEAPVAAALCCCLSCRVDLLASLVPRCVPRKEDIVVVVVVAGFNAIDFFAPCPPLSCCTRASLELLDSDSCEIVLFVITELFILSASESTLRSEE